MPQARSFLVLSSLLALVSPAAFAEEPAAAPVPAPKPAAPKPASAKKPAPAAGAHMSVTRDSETGESRPDTRPEIDRLVGPQPPARPDFVVTILPDGTRQVTLDDRLAHKAVATKREGAPVVECVPSSI